MNRYSISLRLTVLVGALSLLLLTIGSIGLFGIVRSNDALRTVYEDRTVPIAQLGAVHHHVLASRLAIANSLLDGVAQAEIDRNAAKVERELAGLQQQWAAYVATSLTEEEARLVKATEAARDRFLAEGVKPALAALKAGDLASAQRIVITAIRPLAVPYDDGLEKLLRLQVDVAKAEYEQAVARFSTIRAIAIAAIVGGIAFGGWFGLRMMRVMAKDLRAAGELVDAIAAGDLTRKVEVDGRDEIARLLQAMARMQQQLGATVMSVRVNADSVATASQQIANGNLDLSQRTEEQASALQQTAATMEQLASTVRNNAGSASAARGLAVEATSIADRGGAVVADVVTTMRTIESSSRRIADILSVIDGIAFQTNILALNAAVEAARAGEQGRGFAVVAAEVRMLAQRSAAAAKEISTLIADSVVQVNAGTAQVDRAGSTMREIVGAIQRVSEVVEQIAVASDQQARGVSQVGEAVTQMDQSTQQNAALVEESAAAAASLKDQAASLVQAMAVFRVRAAAH